VNFQVSVLKILASYPGRLVTQCDLKRELALLATSGKDWADFSKRLAAGFPQLDIFSSGFVERYSFGWRLSQKGADALQSMEAYARSQTRGDVVPDEKPFQAITAEVHVLDEAVGGETTHFGAIARSPVSAPADRGPKFIVIVGGRP